MNIKSLLIKTGKKIKSNFGWKSALFLAIAVALVLVDILTKIYEEREGWNFVVIPGLIEVVSGVRNPGMAFSFLAEKEWGQAFLIGLTFVMIVALSALILALPERFTLLKLSLYIIVAGAIGNLIDRIAYGYVRDFIWMAIVNAYCNFADVFIVVGTALAVIDMLFFNEYSVFPLTKQAREAQEVRRKNEKALKLAATQANDSKADATPCEDNGGAEFNSSAPAEDQSSGDGETGKPHDDDSGVIGNG